MQNLLKKLALSLLIMLPSMALAQSSCDKYFAEGSKLQQTMTISAQKKAIKCFEKAKMCYDSKQRKEICDQQIRVCRTIISNIQKPKTDKQTDEPEVKPTPIEKEEKPVKKERKTVELSLSEDHLTFKASGGEFKKVKVRCNYDDWEVCEKPDWVMFSRNSENELVIEVAENVGKEERSGVVRVKCGDVEKSLVINQKKYSGIDRLRKKMKL